MQPISIDDEAPGDQGQEIAQPGKGKGMVVLHGLKCGEACAPLKASNFTGVRDLALYQQTMLQEICKDGDNDK